MAYFHSSRRRAQRTLLFLLLCAGGIGLSDLARAQHSVLVLSSRDSPVYRKVTASFESFLQAETAGLEFVSLTLEDDPSVLQQRLESIGGHDVDLVFALGANAIRLATERFPDRSVVATMVLPREELLSLPNVTGVALEFPATDQLQWMRRLLPGANRVGVMFDPTLNQTWVDAARQAAKKEGLTLIPIPVESARELPAGLKKLARDADVLWAIPDKTVFSSQTLKQVLLSSFRSRIPVVGLSRSWVKAGAFYALDRDYQDLGRQNAVIARKLLAGTSVDKIIPETPGEVIYSLNLKTARHMKTDIGDELVAGAAKVYE